MHVKNESTSTTSTQTAAPRPAAPVLIFLLLPLISLVIAAGMLIAGSANNNSGADRLPLTANPLPTHVTMNQPASSFTLTDLEGRSVSLADYAGRTVFVNFWWTGCPPCVKELPDFQTFAAQQGTDGAVVLAVNTAETPEQIRQFLADNDINLPDVPVLLDTDYTVMRAYGVAVFPTTFVISPSGEISQVKFGAFDLEQMSLYQAVAEGRS
jgi:peroxiredoxin